MLEGHSEGRVKSPVVQDDDYIGDDLLAMQAAVNYRAWLMRHFRPFLGQKVLEIGGRHWRLYRAFAGLRAPGPGLRTQSQAICLS